MRSRLGIVCLCCGHTSRVWQAVELKLGWKSSDTHRASAKNKLGKAVQDGYSEFTILNMIFIFDLIKVPS